MSGDPIDLDAIEARASKVPGDIDWWVDGPALRSGKYWIYATGEKFESREVAEHIAGMDRATVLALVAEVRRLREALDLATLMHNRAASRVTEPDPWRGTRP